jgi:hypothetical protein
MALTSNFGSSPLMVSRHYHAAAPTLHGDQSPEVHKRGHTQASLPAVVRRWCVRHVWYGLFLRPTLATTHRRPRRATLSPRPSPPSPLLPQLSHSSTDRQLPLTTDPFLCRTNESCLHQPTDRPTPPPIDASFTLSLTAICPAYLAQNLSFQALG